MGGRWAIGGKCAPGGMGSGLGPSASGWSSNFRPNYAAEVCRGGPSRRANLGMYLGKHTMAVLSPTQPSYLRMAELATLQP